MRNRHALLGGASFPAPPAQTFYLGTFSDFGSSGWNNTNRGWVLGSIFGPASFKIRRGAECVAMRITSLRHTLALVLRCMTFSLSGSTLTLASPAIGGLCRARGRAAELYPQANDRQIRRIVEVGGRLQPARHLPHYVISSSNTATTVGSGASAPTFTVDRGYTRNPSGGYVTLNRAANSAGLFSRMVRGGNSPIWRPAMAALVRPLSSPRLVAAISSAA
jgi:hypothetical protein